MSIIAHPYVGRAEEDREPHQHAVAMALASGSTLLTLHGGLGRGESVVKARETLEAWGRPGDAVRHEDRRYEGRGTPIDVILKELPKFRPTLIVVGTAQRKGLLRMIVGSRAEAIAEHCSVPVLFVPQAGRGIVAPDGGLRIERVVMPCGDAPSTEGAVQRMTWLAELLDLTPLECRLTYVGRFAAPAAPAPHPRIRWSILGLDGDLEPALNEAASEADLVVMATRGHDSWSDRVLGSHTERLLRSIDCPLLSVPI